MHCWDELVKRPMGFREFCTLPMPEKTDPRSLWLIFARMRRACGIVLGIDPWYPVELNISWTHIPKLVDEELYEIVSFSASDSAINRFISSRELVDTNLVPFIIMEVQSVAQRDGLKLDTDAINRIFFGSPAENSNEVVIGNVFKILSETGKFRNRTLDLSFSQYLHERLLEDTGNLELQKQRIQHHAQ